MNINWVEKLPKEIEEKMVQGYIAYEHQHGIDVNFKTFSLILQDDHENVCGVLNAYTAFSEIYVQDIWIDKTFRGQGYGRKLLLALEERYKGKGFNNINLVTSAFQAPEFYKKCGFTLEFIRKNQKNPKLSKYFFVKFFDDEVQTQGILNIKE